MKFFGWMQNKLSGKQGNIHNVITKKSTTAAPFTHCKKQEDREEFSDWPHGLLAIGTFGNDNNNNSNNNSNNDSNNNNNNNNNMREGEEEDHHVDDEELFTPEEMGKLQKELTKLLTRKSNISDKQHAGVNALSTSSLPLDRFLNCPSSLEVDRRLSTGMASSHNGSLDEQTSIKELEERDDDDDEIERTISVILGRCKEIQAKKEANNIGKKSMMSFLVKKMFVCASGFAPQPSLRDTLPESRMEKLLRTLLHKKMNSHHKCASSYNTNNSRASSMKRYIGDKLQNNNNNNYKGKTISMRSSSQEEEEEEEDEHQQQQQQHDQEAAVGDGSKWVKTDSEYIVLEI